MKLKVKNFKCYEEEEISFSNLTVLAGGNGAGKSTIIQSFLLVAQTLEKESYVETPKRLYLNDYYCELGSSKRLLYKEANTDNIEFVFTDDSDNYTKFIGSIDRKDFNILNIEHETNNDNPFENKSLDFTTYFDFIGADRFGPKVFHKTDSNFSRIRVGKYGEYSTMVLDKYKDELLPIKLNGEIASLRTHVNYWMSEIFGYVNIDTEYIEQANVAMLKIKNKLSSDYESPVNMPYGVSYVLPIIVSILVRQIPKDRIFDNYIGETDTESEMVIIENPEAHLHPRAQSRLGMFLSIMSKNVRIILETHSDHIINGIRIAVKTNLIERDSVLFNFFEQGDKIGQNTIRQIDIYDDGNLSDWPKGFFDQYENDLMDLM